MLKDNIQSLITVANATTGKTDTDMTAATQSLIDGFGSGGNSWPVLVSKEETVLAEDWQNDNLGNSNHFSEVFCNKKLDPKQFEVFQILNNEIDSRSYAGKFCINDLRKAGVGGISLARGDNYAWNAPSTLYSFWIRKGATIIKYVFSLEMV